MELGDHPQCHLHHGGIGRSHAYMVDCEESVGLHLVDLREKLSYRPLFPAVLCLLPEISLIIECLVVMLIVGALGRVDHTDGYNGHSGYSGNAIGLALGRDVDLLKALVNRRILGGDFELGDGAILSCFHTVTAAQNFFHSLAVLALRPTRHLMSAKLDRLSVPPEDLLMTDVIGIDSGQ